MSIIIAVMGAGDIGRGGNKMLKECVDAETIFRVYCHLKQVVFKTHVMYVRTHGQRPISSCAPCNSLMPIHINQVSFPF